MFLKKKCCKQCKLCQVLSYNDKMARIKTHITTQNHVEHQDATNILKKRCFFGFFGNTIENAYIIKDLYNKLGNIRIQ